MDFGQRVRHTMSGVKRMMTPKAKLDPFAA
ncbi:MAG: hypothetical protein RL186_24, partial [Pseudomonadota bacterium]